MGVLALGAFCMSYFLLPPTEKEQAVTSDNPSTPWKHLIYDRSIISIFLFRFVYTTCIGIVWGFLPIFADTRFSLSSSSIGILIVLGISVSGFMHIPMGAVADRLNKRILVIAGGGVTAVAIGLIGIAGGFWDLFTANVIFGIGGGISMPSLSALAVVSGNKLEAMGAVMSLITVAHSLGMLCGSVFAGVIMDFFLLEYAFYLGSVIMVIGTVAFGVGMRKS